MAGTWNAVALGSVSVYPSCIMAAAVDARHVADNSPVAEPQNDMESFAC